MGADHHIHIRDHPRYRFAARCVCSACFERRSLNGARGKDRKQKYFTINVKKPLTAPSGSPRWRPSARCCTVSPATVWNTTRSRRKKNDNKKHGDSHAQPVKEPQLSESESWGFPVIWMVTNKYQCENGALPTPLCQLFQIHSSIFKPHPCRDTGQTSVVCIAHGMFFFCIRKNTLNGLFSQGIDFFAAFRFPQLFN